MAKTDTAVAQSEVVAKQIRKKYGDIVFSTDAIKEKKRNIIPLGPNLDLALGGGLLEGTWNIFSGPPKAGKTTLALQAAVNAQQLYNKHVYYSAVEGRFKEFNLHTVKGLNPDLFTVFQSDEGTILTAEKFLDLNRDVIKTHPGSIIIIDSASALCSEKEMTDDITGMTRNIGPKLLASFCRQMGGIVPVQNVTVIIIQHLIANTSGYGSPYVEDGGQKIKYQGDTKIRCKTQNPRQWQDDDGNIIGQTCDWEVVFSALGPPGQKTASCRRRRAESAGL